MTELSEIFKDSTLKPDADLAEVLRAAEKLQKGSKLKRAAIGATLAPFLGLAALMNWLAKRLPQRSAPLQPGDSGMLNYEKPREPTWLDRLSAKLRWRLWYYFMRFAADKQAADYLSKLTKMFESGDLDNALRHAISLGGRGGAAMGGLGSLLFPLLGNLTPNSDFRINLNFPAMGRMMFGFGDDTELRLEKLYREAFEKLDAQDKIKEAAYLLAELLKDTESAVAYLERNGYFREAAELAEGRGLPIPRQVRQWFLANEPDRALSIVKREGAFSDALAMLEKDHPLQAEQLRLIWAMTLAEAGQYARAVEVIWPLDQGSNLAAKWLELAVDAGGEDGARALVRAVTLLPERFHLWKDKLLDLLASEDFQGVMTKEFLAQELMKVRHSPEQRVMIHLLQRQLLLDYGAGLAASRAPASKEPLALLQYAGDRVLRSDVPPIPGQKQSPFRLCPDRPQNAEFQLTGTLPIHDIMAIGNRRYLLALGEAGLAFVNSDGKVLLRHDFPASELVPSEDGGVALAISKDSGYLSIARIDCQRRIVRPWKDSFLDCWAKTHNGLFWLVCRENRAMAINLADSSFKPLWEVSDPAGRLVNIAWIERQAVLIGERSEGEGSVYWCLPYVGGRRVIWINALEGNLTLSQRIPYGEAESFQMHGSGMMVRTVLKRSGGVALLQMDLYSELINSALPGVLQGARPGSLAFNASFLAAAVSYNRRSSISLIDTTRFENKLLAVLHFNGTERLCMKLQQERNLVIGSGSGQILHLYLNQPEKEFRISANFSV